MRLYSGMSQDFIRDVTRNQIAGRLREAFFHYFRYEPGPAEVASWRNSLRAMKDVVDGAKLYDHGVLLEYQLPLSSKRLDCLFCGRDDTHNDRAVIIELKQWEKCDAAEPEKIVTTWVGGAARHVLHPSVQVGQYREYLEDTHTAFHEGDAPVGLSSCSYLHNYLTVDADPILARKFTDALKHSPLFDADDAEELGSFLRTKMASGHGQDVLQRIETSRFRQSRKLMDHVATAIGTKAPWILLDEQLVAFESIRATVASAFFGRTKQVVIVKGGPGTGKSVLAINLLADLMRDGRNTHYATGSKAFTETLWSLLGSRSRAAFKYFNSYGGAAHNEVDVLICDESHRIRETSNHRFTKTHLRSSKPQVLEILDAAKVAVFFIDDRQVVRPNEIGSTQYIASQARERGAVVSEYQLEVQFRCAGSDGFVNWIDNTLEIRRTANVIWEGAEGFEFRILDSPESLDDAIRKRAAAGHTARVAAGFCWPWSEPRLDGTLVDDVVIGSYSRPWDAKPGAKKLAPGIPSASLWATDPKGIDQIGCVYNIQGFELDYVGVIWGPDLRYSFDRQSWIGDKTKSADQVVKRSGDQFVNMVKNTYRVLLSRGMKGCFVHFMDPDTERFVRTRIAGEFDSSVAQMPLAAEPSPEYRDGLEQIHEYVTSAGKVCPLPIHWLAFYEVIERAHVSERPPVPLILAAWDESDALKRERLFSQLKFAERMGVLEDASRFLRSLRPEDWYAPP